MAKLCKVYCVEGKLDENPRKFSLHQVGNAQKSNNCSLKGVNHVDYAMAFIIGVGLRDKEITLPSFCENDKPEIEVVRSL